MFSLPDFFRLYNKKDIYFVDEREILPIFSGYPRGLETNKAVQTLLQVTEKNDKIIDNYKVELDPVLPYFGNFRTYISDFESMVSGGVIRPVQRLNRSVTPAGIDLFLDESSVILMEGFIPKKFCGLKYIPKDSVGFPTTFTVKRINKANVELKSADPSFADVKIDKEALACLINSARIECFVKVDRLSFAA